MEGVRNFFGDIVDWVGSFFSENHKGSFYPTDASFDQWQWFKNTFYLMLKEMLCVMIQLVCFSRTGLGDMFTGSLVLFMMLVSFGFPFLSSHLFLVLRLGPWYKSSMGYMGLFRLLIQLVFVIGSQITGGYAAAEFLKAYAFTWAGSGMSEVDVRKNWIFNRLNGTDSVATSRVDWQFLNVDTNVNSGLPGLEEGVNTFVFMIGLLHLMEVDCPGLLSSAFFNRVNGETPQAVVVDNDMGEDPPYERPGSGLSVPTAAQSRGRRVLLPLPGRNVDGTGSVSVTGGNFGTSTGDNFRRSLDGSIYINHNGIPISLILHASLLLAATQRAFPTTHGTPAISVFLYQMQYTTSNVAISRIIGGFVGALFSLLYYYIWYVWPGNQQRGIAESTVTNLIIGPPSFLQSQLQLPLEMDKKH
jgi:hypothetical protein